MKRYMFLFVMAIGLILVFSIFHSQSNLSDPHSVQDHYEVDRVSIDNTAEKIESSEENTTTEVPIPTTTEEEIASFSTKVSGTSARKNNISICTSILNETIVQPGETFSFWNIIGDTTKDRGFQKAKSFNHDGKTIKTYGGRGLPSEQHPL